MPRALLERPKPDIETLKLKVNTSRLRAIAEARGMSVPEYVEEVVDSIASCDDDKVPLILFLGRTAYDGFRELVVAHLGTETEDDRRELIEKGLLDPEDQEPDIAEQTRLHAEEFLFVAIDEAIHRRRL